MRKQDRGVQQDPPGKDLSWTDAIKKVLLQAGEPLHYTDISERIISQGLRKSVGATPHQTVCARLNVLVKDGSPVFSKVAPGLFGLTSVAQPHAAKVSDARVEPADDSQTGALRAFGMFCQRDLVLWHGRPTLLGRQSTGATTVNFAEQIGVYLLHDRQRVIYVGRADDTLFARLRAHTTNRLGSRWDRFSWFGLRDVDEKGELSDARPRWTHGVVIETMEALLIESLEPPLNRRRGDNFSAAEYIQAPDPRIEGDKLKALFEDFIKSRNEAVPSRG